MKITTLLNPARKPYIYKVTNLETHQYYIGSQCIGKIVGMNYFTSSTNKEFKEGFETYGEEKYKITIVREFEDPEKCVRAENYIIRNYMLKKDGLCVNRFYCCNNKKIFSRVGTHLSEETKHKISTSLKGTHLPEETRKKMSIAKKGLTQSEEAKKKMSIAKKGRHNSEETKKRISEALKGTHLSEETKQKLSATMKGRPSQNQIKISIKNTVFDSLTEAAKYYNVVPSTISYWLKTKKHNAVYIEK